MVKCYFRKMKYKCLFDMNFLSKLSGNNHKYHCYLFFISV